MDEEGEPIVRALVELEDLKAVTTTRSGEFWKLVMPGNYTVVSRESMPGVSPVSSVTTLTLYKHS